MLKIVPPSANILAKKIGDLRSPQPLGPCRGRSGLNLNPAGLRIFAGHSPEVVVVRDVLVFIDVSHKMPASVAGNPRYSLPEVSGSDGQKNKIGRGLGGLIFGN